LELQWSNYTRSYRIHVLTKLNLDSDCWVPEAEILWEEYGTRRHQRLTGPDDRFKIIDQAEFHANSPMICPTFERQPLIRALSPYGLGIVNLVVSASTSNIVKRAILLVELLVEDEPIFRRHLALFLKTEGYFVADTGSGGATGKSCSP